LRACSCVEGCWLLVVGCWMGPAHRGGYTRGLSFPRPATTMLASMKGKRKVHREKNLTTRYLSGDMDEDRVQSGQRFSPRNKAAQDARIVRTALLRAEEQSDVDVEALPVG